MKNSYQVEPATTVQEQPLSNDLAKVNDITTSRNPFLMVLSLFSLYFIWRGTYLPLRLGVGFVGVILLNLGNGMWTNPLGAIALLLAAISWALGSAWSRHISLPPGLMSSAAQMLVGGCVLLVLSLGLRERTPNLAVGQSLWAIAFLIIFGSLL